MKLQVNKVLAKEINKQLLEKNAQFYIYPLTFSEYKYTLACGSDSVYNAEKYGDAFMNANGVYMFKLWRIDYKPELYACNNFVTTYDLAKIRQHIHGVVNIENLTDALIDAYAI